MRQSQLDAFLSVGETRQGIEPPAAVMGDDPGWKTVKSALEATVSAVEAEDRDALEQAIVRLSEAVGALRE